ncbi:MAG: hydrolase [Gammaproteobacteria bacterium]|nr:hydrolase [Gammaproteobacteria bacterium]
MPVNRAEDSVLLIVDIQEKLSPHIFETEKVTENSARLIKTAKRLDIPVVITEQYPRGLGHTVSALQPLLDGCTVMEKIHFGALYEPAIVDRLAEIGRRKVLLTGSETHVCVMQTALALKELGYTPSIVEDASSSRRAIERATGLKRMQQEGVLSVTTEMLMFEWLHRAGTDEFRDVLKLIKD